MEISGKTLEEIDNSLENSHIRLIEAILFVAGRFLSMQDLMIYSKLNSIQIMEALKKLKEKYVCENSALELVSRNNVYKLDVKVDYRYIVNKLATGSHEFTKAEQETLAIIAYKQPIKQSVVIKIRGNKAYDHVHRFLELGLIKSKKEGHTNILTLSDEFYDYFNISGTGENAMKEKVYDDSEE
jgi:segregation and condensation protein B